MSENPFEANVAIAKRRHHQETSFGDDLRNVAAMKIDKNLSFGSEGLGHVLTHQDCGELMQQFQLPEKDDLMCLLVGQAAKLACPAISEFYVGAVGLEAETGHLILGGNLEFPNTQLATTVHGEGFVMTRAFTRGTTIKRIALAEAHPCGHCRQFLSEFSGAAALELIDPLGHTLTLSQLLPWPFDPNALGQVGARPGELYFKDIALDCGQTPVDVITALLSGGQKAYAPYSGVPVSVALVLMDGTITTGMSIESVAFNPSLSAAQTSLINLLANGSGFDDIAEVFIAFPATKILNLETSLATVFQSVAPKASIRFCNWSETHDRG